jgi:ABC-type nickel/cobalt efflux system permease component RcnA
MIPVLLIVLGVLFLLVNLHLMDLEKLLKFWPVALILLGAWMLYERLRFNPKPSGPAGPENPVDGGGAL